MIAEFNYRTFRRPELAHEFSTWDWIESGEDLLLDRVANEPFAGAILEIGVGGGRLVSRLLQISRNYTGVDYSPEMVEVCRKRFPGVVFLCSDARNLGQFQNESFALVVFSFNGIDYVPHEDRMRVLHEIWRVLKDGGFFLFSSHNLESSLYLQQAASSLSGSRGYSIVRENMRIMACFCYYATQSEVRRQLRVAGFQHEARCCDRDGRSPAVNLRSGWLHYLVRK